MDCIIQARMSSTRLPGKVLMKIENEKTVLEFVLNQCKESKLLDRMIIATTNKIDDQEIVKAVKKLGFDYFCGNESDVLDRYYKCAKEFKCKNIVRITSDCPLIDPEIIDNLIEIFLTHDLDYVTNKLPINSPSCNQGSEIEIFSFNVLKKIWTYSKKPSEREHVTPYIYNNPSKFKILNIPSKGMNSLRYTIDRENDLKLVQKIVSLIKNRPILTTNIETLFRNDASLFQINSEYQRNAGYFKSIQNEK